MRNPNTDFFFDTKNAAAMKSIHSNPVAPVSAFTILIERAVHVFSQVLLLPSAAPRSVPARSTHTARRS